MTGRGSNDEDPQYSFLSVPELAKTKNAQDKHIAQMRAALDREG
jgi:hypothetical protein